MEESIKKIRHDEIDLAKAICIIGMVIVHVFESFYFTELVPDSFTGILLNNVQMLVGAPCFMFCMGASIVFSSHNSPKQIVKRGIKIFIFAYVLNFIRTGLFYIILSVTKVTPFSLEILLYEVLGVDIMHFAGLALMLMGFLKKINFDEIKIVIVGVMLSIIGSIIRFIPLENMSVYLVGLFFGTINPNLLEYLYPTCFPLCNWFIFVAFGYLFGCALNKVINKKKFYGILLPLFFVIVISYLIYAIPRNIGMLNGDYKCYYQLLTYEALISISACIVYLGIFYFLSLIIPKFFINICNSFSKNINRIYCVHWVIIGNVTIYVYFVNSIEFSSASCLIFSAGVVIVSYIIVFLYEKITKAKV